MVQDFKNIVRHINPLGRILCKQHTHYPFGISVAVFYITAADGLTLLFISQFVMVFSLAISYSKLRVFFYITSHTGRCLVPEDTSFARVGDIECLKSY